MSEAKDPAIKLFGRTIPLQETQIPVDPGEKSDPPAQIPVMSEEDKDVCRVAIESEASGSPEKEPFKAGAPVLHNNGNGNSHQTITKENGAMLNPKPEDGQMETDSDGQEKVLKKPDKILPCPRCNSLDTKFCYYNNYNVNQPRHFCKNCQRYWTAGGTMRNVPVGAGRRKNKHIASQYRQLMMSSEGTPTTQVDSPESISHQGLSSGGVAAPSVPINANGTVLRASAPSVPIDGNGAVLRFGPDVPLCESMASGLNLGDQNKKVELPTMICGENGEEPSPCSSSMTSSTVCEKELPGRIVQIEHGGMPGCFSVINPPHPLQCYPGPPWPYPWNSGWNNVAAIATGRCSSELVPGSDNGSPKPVQWGSAPMMAAPGLCAPTMPFPFVPASYWGCMPNWAARAWNMPWIGPNGSISPPSSTSNSGCSSNGSPTLGKHSRDANLQGEEKPEKCLWVPKTLRIDDPDDAAKSSIWATLGIKPDKNEPITKGGIFKAFHQKTDGNCASDAEQVLQANPAALSRSQSFQENT